MIEDVVIIGTGGFAREIQDVVRHCNRQLRMFNLLGFIDDFVKKGTVVNGIPVLGDFGWFKTPEARGVCATVGVGAPEVRRKLVNRLKGLGVGFFTVIDPSVSCSPFVEFGKGVVVTPGCVLTNNIKIGNHVHINLNSTVGHDAVMEDFTTTAPGVHVNGNNLIKEGVYLGTGANLVEKITIGEWSIIGAGAAVVGDIPANVTAVGCPAKVIKTREEGWYDV
jgi:sugar O-acyltransferase (sialic acid O-acetyltransferase NeuD family)